MDIQKITISGLFIAIGVLLPQIFHLIGGSSLGQIFLPMHYGVFFAGFFLRGYYAPIIGLITPLLSFALTGMPAIPMLFFMMCELLVYGAVTSISYNHTHESSKLSIYIKLIIAMICGRIASGIAMAIAVLLFALPIDPITAVVTAFVAGIPGIVLQLVIIPSTCILLKRGGVYVNS